MARNGKLWSILHSDLGQDEMYDAVVHHEDEGLDYIRIQAAEHGLFPAIVAKVLMESALGSWLTPEEIVQLSAQEAQQQAELAEMIRRLGGGA
jgi:hypothetical protein